MANNDKIKPTNLYGGVRALVLMRRRSWRYTVRLKFGSTP